MRRRTTRRGDLARLAAATGAVLWAILPARTVVAYNRYNDGCQACHGAFTGGTSPKGTVFPQDSKHEMHRGLAYMATACDLCHTDGDGRNPFTGSSNGTLSNPGVGCTGCHGRDYGGSVGNSGVGLRAHHAFAGVTFCAGCHPSDPTPLPENVQPTYYGTSDTNADDSCNSAPDFLENWSVGDTEGLDNDGDGLYDAADPDVPRWYRDADGDGFGSASQSQPACDQPVGYVADNTDCDDGDPAVHPGAAEDCDGKDTDCVGGIPADELDNDGDSFAACDGDCDDSDDTVFPGAAEICDGNDNDCDGLIDEEIPTWNRDADGDGFGDPADSLQSCDQPLGYVFDASDCDDGDEAVFPGAPELCDGLDNDCDGNLPLDEVDDDADGIPACDDNCPTQPNADQADADGDGVGDACDETEEPGETGTDTGTAGEDGVAGAQTDAATATVEGLEEGTSVTLQSSPDGSTTLIVGEAVSPALTFRVEGPAPGADLAVAADPSGGWSIVVTDAEGDEALDFAVAGLGSGVDVDVRISPSGDQSIVLSDESGARITLELAALPAGAHVEIEKNAAGALRLAVTDQTGERVDVEIETSGSGDDVVLSLTYDAPPAGSSSARLIGGAFAGLKDQLSYGGSVTIDATGLDSNGSTTVALTYSDADVATAGINEAKLRLHKLNASGTRFEPAGANDVGVSAPTETLGDFGVDTGKNSAWAVVSALGTFAVGVPSTGREPLLLVDVCGALCGPIGLVNMLFMSGGLLAIKRLHRRA